MGTAWNVPVFLGEFGVSHDNDGALDYMTAHFAALDALGMSGTEWEYSVESQEWNSETDSVVAADGTEYPVAAALVRPFARAVAGDSIAQAWDPDTATFTLSYVPSSSASTPDHRGAAPGARVSIRLLRQPRERLLRRDLAARAAPGATGPRIDAGVPGDCRAVSAGLTLRASSSAAAR